MGQKVTYVHAGANYLRAPLIQDCWTNNQKSPLFDPHCIVYYTCLYLLYVNSIHFVCMWCWNPHQCCHQKIFFLLDDNINFSWCVRGKREGWCVVCDAYQKYYHSATQRFCVFFPLGKNFKFLVFTSWIRQNLALSRGVWCLSFMVPQWYAENVPISAVPLHWSAKLL